MSSVMRAGANYSISQANWLPLMRRWSGMSPQERADAGEGVKIIGRWHDMAARTGVVILESSDLAALQRFVGRWNPYLDVDLAPVLDDEESAAVARQIIADNNTSN
jgi:hypothetical protein